MFQRIEVTSCFQKVLSRLFAKYDFAKVYIDDIIVHSASFIEHLQQYTWETMDLPSYENAS